MSRFRILDGAYAGHVRETLGSQGTRPDGNATTGSSVLNEAQAVKIYNYTPPIPPVVPPSGFKFYRLYFDTYGTRLYLSEVQFSTVAVFDAGQIVLPTMTALMTGGGNGAAGTVLYDGVWPSPFWSGPSAGEVAPYTMVVFGLPQASPIRSIRVRTGGGGTAPSTARVDVSNDETAPGSFPFNGKAWDSQAIQFPTWTLFDAFNKYADLAVDPGV